MSENNSKERKKLSLSAGKLTLKSNFTPLFFSLKYLKSDLNLSTKRFSDKIGAPILSENLFVERLRSDFRYFKEKNNGVKFDFNVNLPADKLNFFRSFELFSDILIFISISHLQTNAFELPL